MKSFFYMLGLSVKLPQRKAVFVLNRKRVAGPFFYLCLLLFVVSIPLGAQMFLESVGPLSELPVFLFVLYFLLIFYPLFVLAVLAVLSILTAVIYVVSLCLHRKLTYLMIWKITLFAATLPLVGYGWLVMVQWEFMEGWVGLSTLFMLVVLIKTVLIYPPIKRKKG
ncbi:hypothetical protein [Shouchella shacheensis]|uniref:hypothetical protein n=1 Tax=Shouchella shacheensis TaxID=1649580 RepID=UPI00073FB259|nr:hypothetical protein [Shouchella shacheensis]